MSEPVSPADCLEQADACLRRRDLPGHLRAIDAAAAAGAEPDACASRRWLAAMLQGDFEQAWQQSDAIRAGSSADPHRFWNGEDMTGKRVMLRCLHGFGDAVQMLRYAPHIAQRAQSLTVEVPPAFVGLAGMFEGVSDVITWGDDAPEVAPVYDIQMEINELPFIFRTQMSELPVADRYLRLPTERGAGCAVQPVSADALRVGLVWASGSWNPARSLPTDLLHALFEVAGVEFWNLQGGAGRNDMPQFGVLAHAHRADVCADNLVALAHMIEQMDLVITPDTLAAHLAGALGVEAWVMLEYAADWRWQHARMDSPWYSTLRLFRQQTPGDWPGVVHRVHHELVIRAGKRSAQ